MSLVHILSQKGSRCSGRTTMLALHYVQLILDNPGQTVQIEDHFPSYEADRHLFDLVCRALSVFCIKYDYDKSKMQIKSALNPYQLTKYPDASECVDAHNAVLWEYRRQSNSNLIR